MGQERWGQEEVRWLPEAEGVRTDVQDNELLHTLSQFSREELREELQELLRHKRRTWWRLFPYRAVAGIVLLAYYAAAFFFAAAPYVAAYHVFGGLWMTMLVGTAGFMFVAQATERLKPRLEWLYSAPGWERWAEHWNRLEGIEAAIETRLRARDHSFVPKSWR